MTFNQLLIIIGVAIILVSFSLIYLSKRNNNILEYGIMLIGFTIVLFGLVWKPPNKTCEPSEEQKKKAAPDGDSNVIASWIVNPSGECVANTCIDGYTLNNGICKKEINDEISITKATYHGQCDDDILKIGLDATSAVRGALKNGNTITWDDLTIDKCPDNIEQWIDIEYTKNYDSRSPIKMKPGDTKTL